MSAIIRRRGIIGADDGKLWLYKDGDECTDVTGGWVGKVYNYESGYYSDATHEKRQNELYLYATGYSKSPGFFTNQKVNMNGYSKLKFEISSASLSSSGAWNTFCCSTTQLRDNYVKEIHYDSTGVFNIDISSISASLYVGIGLQQYGKVTQYVNLKRIWLEK